MKNDCQPIMKNRLSANYEKQIVGLSDYKWSNMGRIVFQM